MSIVSIIPCRFVSTRRLERSSVRVRHANCSDFDLNLFSLFLSLFMKMMSLICVFRRLLGPWRGAATQPFCNRQNSTHTTSNKSTLGARSIVIVMGWGPWVDVLLVSIDRASSCEAPSLLQLAWRKHATQTTPTLLAQCQELVVSRCWTL